MRPVLSPVLWERMWVTLRRVFLPTPCFFGDNVARRASSLLP